MARMSLFDGMELFEETEEIDVDIEEHQEYADCPEQIAEWLREFIARDAE